MHSTPWDAVRAVSKALHLGHQGGRFQDPLSVLGPWSLGCVGWTVGLSGV